MKKILRILTISILLVICAVTSTNAQGYLKLNGLYALGGIINPQLEARISKHSTLQTELVYSPWRSINGHHLHFGIFTNEYRYFFREANDGWYLGVHAGIMLMDVSKPQIVNGKFSFQNRYSKGYGILGGAVVGYEWRFAERWLLDAYVGFGYLHSTYNGYSLDGKIDMHPHRPDYKQPEYADPLNASAEWLPTKVGLSIGFLLWK